MKIKIVIPERGTAMACDECGFWPKRLIEISLDKTPVVSKLCLRCAGKVVGEIQQLLPWAGSQEVKRNAVGG